MLSEKVWNELNKNAKKYLAPLVGKTLTLNNTLYIITRYTLSTQLILKDINGNEKIVWLDEVKKIINDKGGEN